MARRALVLLAAALLLGGLATWLTAGWLDRTARAQAHAAAPSIPVVPVLVAAAELKPGDTLAPSMVRWQPWPRASLRPEYLIKGQVDTSVWYGAMARFTIASGEPLRPDHLVKRGDRGIMAALIAPGRRAMSIAVTPASGLAGFVGPGDRVDVLMTANQGTGGRILGRTVATDLRVLAIDQRIEPVTALANGGRSPPAAPTTVTLEVTPRQAEEIAVSQELGRLSLTLRDLQAQGEPAPVDRKTVGGRPVFDNEITRLADMPSAPRDDAALPDGVLPFAFSRAMPGTAGPAPAARLTTSGSVEVVRGSVAAGPASAAPVPAPEVP